MAPVNNREKMLKQAAGLSYLQTGELPKDGAFDIYNEDELRIFLNEYRLYINKNVKMDVREDADAGPVSFSQQPAAETPRIKDVLKKKIADVLDDGQYPANDGLAIKSVMSISGYDVDLDNSSFTEAELSALGRFQNNVDTLSLEQIANSNFILKAEEESRAAAKAEMARKAEAEVQSRVTQEADLKGSVASMLVYGGYLKAEDAGDNKHIASAMQMMMTIVTPHNEFPTLPAEEAKIFADTMDWKLNPYALDYVNKHLAGIAPRSLDGSDDLLREHLTSNDPEMIKLAQGYLIAQGADGVKISGEIDPATYDAATAELKKPLPTPPPGLYADDGSLRLDNMLEMAVRGQLYLPADKLSEADKKILDTLPYAADRGPGDIHCKEKFLANRLILQDPEGYLKLLEQENAARANATLDAQVVLPKVAVPPTATIVEEQLDIANNPAGLIDNPEGDAVYDASQPIVDGIKENGIGVTERMGFVVFEGKPVALSGIVEAIKLDQGAFGDGNADNLIGMDGAINLVRGAVNVNDIGMTGVAIPLSPDDVWAINESLGYDQYHRFDITNPVEMQALLNGVITYQNVKAAGVPFTQDFIAQYSTIERPDVKTAVGIASGVTPAADPKPVEPKNDGAVETSALKGTFTVNANGVTVDTSGQKPSPVADNNDRKLAAASGADFNLG